MYFQVEIEIGSQPYKYEGLNIDLSNQIKNLTHQIASLAYKENHKPPLVRREI